MSEKVDRSRTQFHTNFLKKQPCSDLLQLWLDKKGTPTTQGWLVWDKFVGSLFLSEGST